MGIGCIGFLASLNDCIFFKNQLKYALMLQLNVLFDNTGPCPIILDKGLTEYCSTLMYQIVGLVNYKGGGKLTKKT